MSWLEDPFQPYNPKSHFNFDELKELNSAYVLFVSDERVLVLCDDNLPKLSLGKCSLTFAGFCESVLELQGVSGLAHFTAKIRVCLSCILILKFRHVSQSKIPSILLFTCLPWIFMGKASCLFSPPCVSIIQWPITHSCSIGSKRNLNCQTGLSIPKLSF